jgi:TetR/AcrR family transcriptional repressor of nem operon
MFLNDLSETDHCDQPERCMPRPKSYDPHETLNSAMQLFWTDGFEVTSIPKLEEGLGINRFSIYDSFGSKRSLFLKSLDVYTDMLVDKLIAPLEMGTDGMKDIGTFLESWIEIFLKKGGHRGCLLCNSAIELGSRDEEVAAKVRSYFERIEGALAGCLIRASKTGEIAGNRTLQRHRARAVRLSMEGVLTDIRLGQDDADIQLSLDAVKASLLPM